MAPDAAAVADSVTAAARNGSHQLASVSGAIGNASDVKFSRHGNGTAVGEDTENVGTAVAVFYGVLVVMISAQTAVLWWKRKHKRSYELTTLLGLWLFPAVIAFHFSFWRFCTIWGAFTGVTGYLLSRCVNRRQLDPKTPSRVYSWFLGTHKVSVVLGVTGYALVVAEVFGGAPLMRLLRMPQGTSLLLLWYGLYFGVLGRDLAEVASDRIAAVMGGGRRLASSLHSCGICGGELDDARTHLSGAPPANGAAPSVQLACCKQLFHSLCIKGWTLVGKKDSCPVCREKIDLRQLYGDRPWETRNLSWIQMLDAVRYFLVWNPLLLVGVHYALKALGIAPHPHTALTDGEMAQQLGMGVNVTRGSGLVNVTGNGSALLP